VPAQRKDTRVRGAFAKHIIKHIDHWFAFAQDHGFGINREDIILVTGCHLARSWANIVFQESLMEERVSFGVQVAENSDVNWRFTPEGVRGMPFTLGPSGQVRFCTNFLRQCRRDGPLTWPDRVRIYRRTSAYSSRASVSPVLLREYFHGFEERQGQLAFRVKMIMIPTLMRNS